MKRTFVLVFASLLLQGLCGCTKINDAPIDNLRGGKIHVIGHAGLGFESMLSPYPSNTLTSIRKLIEGYAADGTEVDVQLSQDSVPVLYHDQNLESMTNCFGTTLEHLAHQLFNCSYRTDFHSHILQNEKIISLGSVLQRYAGTVHDPWFYLDLKYPDGIGAADTAAYTGRFMRAVHRVVTEHNMAHRTVAEAGDLELLLTLRQLNPAILLMYDSNDFELALQTAIDHQLFGIVIGNDHINKEQVKRAHQNGIQVAIFGVILRRDIVDAVNKHPDIIQTDNIGLLQQILSE